MILKLLLGTLCAINATAGNVIFVTTDGVRPEDAAVVFQDATPYKYNIQVTNLSAQSLPGYRALFTGEFERRCVSDNRCSNIDRETIFDHLINTGTSLKKVAAFASWRGLELALETKPRIVRSVAGKLSGATSDLSEDVRERITSLNNRALADLPRWKDAVKDEYTWTDALVYLQVHQPQFMYIGLMDTDGWASDREVGKYFEALHLLKNRLELLRSKLDTLGSYGRNTTIVLTTDHGRGRGPLFSKHGPRILHSFKAWARVFPAPALQDNPFLQTLDLRSQTDIRPLLEKLIDQP